MWWDVWVKVLKASPSYLSVSMRQTERIPPALTQFQRLITDTAAPEIAAKLQRRVT